jgi:2-polyprenyl-3-methyl-5-hydroxy-6-metoxy-1,4-benzoquinol methylase
VLTEDEALGFWERRHASRSALRSGGDWGATDEENEILYRIRAGLLLSIVGGNTSPRAPVEVLDAGCGKGYYSRMFAECGFRVTAFDPSASALAELPVDIQRACSTIQAFSACAPFDVVLCCDVLFHITEDPAWHAATRRLGGLTRLSGQLIISDVDCATRVMLGDYIVHRPVNEYLAVLGPLGFRRTAHHPYNFKQNQVGFSVWERG